MSTIFTSNQQFVFFTALLGLTSKKKKEEETHNSSTQHDKTKTQKGGYERDARSHARHFPILKSNLIN